jgi:hypothetical protein
MDDIMTQNIKRLSIVIPYRDRQAHLAAMVPHLRAYFTRDKLDCIIPYRVLVVEQEIGLPFNRGALNNVGFVLGREHGDYTCFHDVDYLPIWADYSWSDTPTCIVWYGAESRPLLLAQPKRRTLHNLNEFYGAVMLTPNALFDQVNGYANTYWGWGYEDVDLKNRYDAAGIAFTRRKGSFHPLEHDHNGLNLDYTLKPVAAANHQHFKERCAGGASVHQTDGLRSLDFEILDRRPIPDGPIESRPALYEHVKVRLNIKSPGQR